MILDSGKTPNPEILYITRFESVVILDSGKTMWKHFAGMDSFESVVILDSGKTFTDMKNIPSGV